MIRNLLATIIASVAISAAAQTSTTLTFDGFTHPAVSTAPTAYRGLTFGESFQQITTGGNTYLATSLSNGSTLVRQTSGQSFYLDAIDVWSRRGLDANGTMYLVLYSGATTVYSSLAVPRADDPTKTDEAPIQFLQAPQTINVAALYSGLVTGVAFSFKTNPSGAGDWDHFATDNWVLRTSDPAVLPPAAPVPEPSTVLLFLAGLLTIGALSKVRHARR